jgi:hypothetical protein
VQYTGIEVIDREICKHSDGTYTSSKLSLPEQAQMLTSSLPLLAHIETLPSNTIQFPADRVDIHNLPERSYADSRTEKTRNNEAVVVGSCSSKLT